MKIAYVTAYDITNVRKVNGAGQYIAECLRDQGLALEFLCVQFAPTAYLVWMLLKAREQLHRRMHPTVYVATRSRLLAHLYARQIAARLAQSDADLVFSPICPGSLPISYLETDKPMVIWADATFAGLLNFYPGFTNLAPQTIKDGLANERAALARCRLAIFSSAWAAQTALEAYDTPSARLGVVPFGPYLRIQLSMAEVQQLIVARSTKRCKLLFMARDWQRKGGDVALATVAALRAMGVQAELTIVGSQPPADERLPDYVHPLGFLNKATQQGQRTLRQLYAESHFLLVPSRADCAPAAIREASAYGLPCVTTTVGGLASLVHNGQNGWAFPSATPATVYADYIAKLFGDVAGYRRLALSSFALYQTHLSWASAGRAVKALLEEVLSAPKATDGVPVQLSTNP